MAFEWSSIKDVIFTLGSIAGAVALFRPLAESKFQRDVERANRIKAILNEQQIVDIERCVTARKIPRSYFQPFTQLAHELETNQDVIRFSGPFAKLLDKELRAIVTEYKKLREYVQVSEWEPRSVEIDGETHETWDFNKSAFADENNIPQGYAGHLYATEKQATEILNAFQRFQIVTELHLLEMPLSKWLVNRRFKARGLCATET